MSVPADSSEDSTFHERESDAGCKMMRSRILLAADSLGSKYRVEGHDFIALVDVSWNEEWNGTEQRLWEREK